MSMSSTTLRLDSDLKRRIEKRLKDTGLSLNAYFTLAAKQLDIQEKIPFEIKTPVEKPTSETMEAILLAQAKDNNVIPDDTPGFTDSKKMIEYMKKRAKELE